MPADAPVLLASNRGYRYGDGLFETMKIMNGKIILASMHFERLSLCKRNECDLLARVRLSAFRGNGGLYDEDRGLQYIIECWSLTESVNELNTNGLVIDIYPEAKKTCDLFSNLKSASFLPYAMAALYAKENKLNDCLVLNTKGNIADSTITNVFIIKNELIITPALNEGCVNGIMRKYLLKKLQDSGYRVQESCISVFDIENADEVLLTNAINGIRWVSGFRHKLYSNSQSVEIYNRFVKTILL